MDNMDNMDVKIRVRLGEQHRCEGLFLHNECPGTSEQHEYFCPSHSAECHDRPNEG